MTLGLWISTVLFSLLLLKTTYHQTFKFGIIEMSPMEVFIMFRLVFNFLIFVFVLVIAASALGFVA